MKKLMFNDKHFLTDAVLSGRKTMTRRIIPKSLFEHIDFEELENGNTKCYHPDLEYPLDCQDLRGVFHYVGEVVAIAQAYKDIPEYAGDPEFSDLSDFAVGWNNKMFVRANMMPHRIKITDIKIERLKDISDEDCIKEGITRFKDGLHFPGPTLNGYDIELFEKIEEFTINYQFKEDPIHCKIIRHPTPQLAFASLIDKTCGNGTWAKNPWVFVYEFELVK